MPASLSHDREARGLKVLRAVRDVIDAEGSEGAEALLSSLVGGGEDATPPASPAPPSLAAAGAQVRGAQRRSPAPQRATAGATLVASGVPQDSERLAEAWDRAAQGAQRDRAGNHHSVFSASWSFPSERALDPTDSIGNDRKMSAIASPTALVASGGAVGADVDFTVPVLSNDSRPIRDGSPVFGAKRGSVRFQATPSLSSSNAASATGVYTQAQDVSGAAYPKAVMKINTGTEEQVWVDAVSTRLQIGNLQGRFNPEYAEAMTQLAATAQARAAELNLLSKISAGSVAVSSGQLLGAARDFLGTLDQAVAAMRYRHRMIAGHAVTALLPVWIQNLLRADLTREMAHGDELTQGFDLTAAQLDSLLTARGVQAIWLEDGQGATTPGGISVPAQGFGAQAAGALLDFPRTVSWWLYPQGTWVVLDGGVLNLGIVRDSQLSSSNDYEVFSEQFEGLAFRGVESLEVVSTVRPNGLSAGTVNTSTY